MRFGLYFLGLRAESLSFELNNTVRKFGWRILVSGMLFVSAGYVSNFVGRPEKPPQSRLGTV